MTRMVQVAMAGDVTEAEELQTILRSAGIDVGARGRRRPPSARDRGRPAEGAGAGGLARGGSARDRGAHRARGARRRKPDFGRVAGRYDELRPADENWWEVFELLVREGDLVGRRVLDIGCGTGRAAAALAERGSRVWGVEPEPEMAALARERLSTVKVAPAERLPFKDGWFDRALMWLVLHLVDRPRALAEAWRVLAPDGRLAIATFHWDYFERPLARARSSRRSRRSTAPSSRRPTSSCGELEAAGFGSVSHTRARPAGVGRPGVRPRARARNATSRRSSSWTRTSTERGSSAWSRSCRRRSSTRSSGSSPSRSEPCNTVLLGLRGSARTSRRSARGGRLGGRAGRSRAAGATPPGSGPSPRSRPRRAQHRERELGLAGRGSGGRLRPAGAAAAPCCGAAERAGERSSDPRKSSQGVLRRPAANSAIEEAEVGLAGERERGRSPGSR